MAGTKTIQHEKLRNIILKKKRQVLPAFKINRSRRTNPQGSAVSSSWFARKLPHRAPLRAWPIGGPTPQGATNLPRRAPLRASLAQRAPLRALASGPTPQGFCSPSLRLNCLLLLLTCRCFCGPPCLLKIAERVDRPFYKWSGLAIVAFSDVPQYSPLRR